MILTEKEHKEVARYCDWIMVAFFILVIILIGLCFVIASEPEDTTVIEVHHQQQGLNMDRIWMIHIEDDNIALLVSGKDTIMLALENTYGLTDINPVVFTNIY